MLYDLAVIIAVIVLINVIAYLHNQDYRRRSK